MFHPMDPMGPIMHHFESRFNAIEKHLGIDNSEYKKDDDTELLSLSIQEVKDIIQIQKNVNYNREWNSIVKDIKSAAKAGNTPIVIYFNMQQHKPKIMKKLKSLGFELEKRNEDSSEEEAVAYNITIKKEQI